MYSAAPLFNSSCAYVSHIWIKQGESYCSSCHCFSVHLQGAVDLTLSLFNCWLIFSLFYTFFFSYSFYFIQLHSLLLGYFFFFWFLYSTYSNAFSYLHCCLPAVLPCPGDNCVANEAIEKRFVCDFYCPSFCMFFTLYIFMWHHVSFNKTLTGIDFVIVFPICMVFFSLTMLLSLMMMVFMCHNKKFIGLYVGAWKNKKGNTMFI